ncbi:MAG: M28 family peptidase [Saprospirales bacterium]|nr:M28 family peptidase [Saprospirales bacterium]
MDLDIFYRTTKNKFFLRESLFLFLVCVLSTLTAIAQGPPEDKDALFIREIHDIALTQGSCYGWLTDLTTVGFGRLAGSPAAAAAVDYTRKMLDTLGVDSVWLQPCRVPRWVRGEKEQVQIVLPDKKTIELKALALGNSIGTGANGITAPVIEVRSLDEVDSLPDEAVKGKIVFFNRPMDPRQINTFNAYGGAVDQRVYGASRAAKKGAVAVVVRSMTNRLDDNPHTGTLSYQDPTQRIPAVAISTNDAEKLSALLKGSALSIYLRTTCETLSDVESFNVIAEWRGSERPGDIILVGGHLDAWDVGGGAHDDGSGCVQAMDVLQILKRLNYQPKHTIRCVLFMNEENGLVGGRTYWQTSNELEEYHMAAIESDRGGFSPRGFTAEGHVSIFQQKYKHVYQWEPLLEPYGLHLRLGGSGADISGLKDQKGLLFGLDVDTQRYFDFHHTAVDVIEAVNERELELGAAAMTSLVFLLDQYGLE